MVVQRNQEATEFERPQAEELDSWVEDYALGEIWEKEGVERRVGMRAVSFLCLTHDDCSRFIREGYCCRSFSIPWVSANIVWRKRSLFLLAELTKFSLANGPFRWTRRFGWLVTLEQRTISCRR